MTDSLPSALEYILTHVFLPVELPIHSDYTPEKDQSLVHAVCSAARAYSSHISGTPKAQWHRITKMLDNLQASIQSEYLDKGHVFNQLRAMETNDVLTFFIRHQNAAVILTKQDNSTLFESFEVSPHRDAVEKASGPLTCSYPSSAVEIPNKVFRNMELLSELAGFLSRAGAAESDLTPTRSESLILLPPSILRRVRRLTHVSRITKRVRDEAGRKEEHSKVEDIWRRSSLWLLIRVIIQKSFGCSSLGRASYKQFILFFLCTLTADHDTASSDMLHLMACKILRRLCKLRSSLESIPERLSEMALKTCGNIRETPHHKMNLKETQPFVLNSHEYIRDALANHNRNPVRPPFQPSHRHRGTLEDFLSCNGAFFEEAYEDDHDVTLYDVELAVEQEIDGWVAGVVNVSEACAQIEILMDKYMHIRHPQPYSPEFNSITLLMGIELFVAVDKLILGEIPMLADYSPEIPLDFLQKLCLRKRTSLHRLACAYQYLHARHSQSRTGWSVLSHEFTENSFPVRYYDQSSHLQHSKARMDEDGVPLPESSLSYKTIVFELQCPTCVRIWRSAIARVLHYFHPFSIGDGLVAVIEENLLARCPDFRPYLVDRDMYDSSLHVVIQCAYVHPGGSQPRDKPPLCYAIRYPDFIDFSKYFLKVWKPTHYDSEHLISPMSELESRHDGLGRYASNTSHTGNDVLAAQAKCPTDLSLDEFVALAQLRSGGSLQWLNLLQILRGRRLNFRRYHVYHLLVHTAFQVGPLDINTGVWVWHQELEDAPFCNTLLGELESLFLEAGNGSIDWTVMLSISLLLTRILTSSPSKNVSDRTITFIRDVRRKTFSWFEELSYNLAMAPTNEERGEFLLRMAVTCRSTFLNVDPIYLPQLLYSAEDVDAFISCALFIYALRPKHSNDPFLRELQDSRTSLTVESLLRGTILTDPSEYGIDLAVRKMFGRYQPGTQGWERLQDPNARWLTCKPNLTMGQSVYLDLLEGQLRVDGQILSGIPHEIKNISECQQIFHDQGFLVIPSDLPGMDFTTHFTERKHRVHYSLRDGILVVRVQSNGTRDILELIPSYVFWKDLPSPLVNGHVHWLNLSTEMIEIRPVERLWEQSPENWMIDCRFGKYRVHKGQETLVNIQSPTWKAVSTYFECLNNVQGFRSKSRNLLMTASESRTSSALQPIPGLRLSVALPHYSLSFFVNAQGELESHDFKDMVYDENQAVGTLFGLENLFVLRARSSITRALGSGAYIPRRVLIPDGILEQSDHNRIRVRIRYNIELVIPGDLFCHSYDMDTEMGCLTGNHSSTSMHYLAHLHAMTSHGNRPDPLTGKTGFRAGHRLLQSARCQSIMEGRALNFDDEFWRPTQCPQLDAAHEEIQRRYYWNRDRLRHDNEITDVATKRAMHRAVHFFSLDEKGTQSQITLERLFHDRSTPSLPPRTELREGCKRSMPSPSSVPALDQLFSSLPTDTPFRESYVTRLESSANFCGEYRLARTELGMDHYIEVFKIYYAQCRHLYSGALSDIQNSLSPTSDPFAQTLHQFGQWPLTTPDILLQCLASTSSIELPPSWKKCLTSLALLLLDLQRSRRLLRLTLNGLEEEFLKELDNEPCDGWNPEEYPDWLLIQIDGDFLIRRSQAETARELMFPTSGKNTVMQIHMGEGKSSVIIPITAAALADGKQLVRVIAPKALTVQMFKILVARLGGLANRPVYHLPFSRSQKHLDVDNLHKLMVQCMTERGILLVAPEHVVSLKLTSIEGQTRKHEHIANRPPKLQHWMHKHLMARISAKSADNDGSDDNRSTTPGDQDSASKWKRLQTWVDAHSRDVLDESDEILHARFHLIYTIGHQQHMDGYPDRWSISQQVLQLVKKHGASLSRYAAGSMQYEGGPPGSFPYIRIMPASDTGRKLIGMIVEDVMGGQLPSFDFRQVPVALQEAVRGFIADENVSQVPDTLKKVEAYAKDSYESHLWSGLLLLRGLLASKILLFSLSEWRWRVNYGLVPQPSLYNPFSPTPSPSLLAVPYRAKDEAALNSQFGHPDITIILTCLSYYYGGLSEQQLRTSFEILLDEDDPSAEYARWIKELDHKSLPESLWKLGEINLRSSEQWDKGVLPHFRRNKAVIDFYLSRVVFPKEAKEYHSKISSSSWDIAEGREKLVTGFSGTSDGRWLLSLSIAQRDLPQQQGCDARVLGYLAQPENDYTVIDESRENWSTTRFLQMIATKYPEIRILLDVGAQILDFSNSQVAKAWLEIARHVSGAIYFNEEGDLMVLTRGGATLPLSASPLSKQLEHCVVYLDHVHTRGTDLRLPINSRAAITLGPKVTKDGLVQGCMRMRKLGNGHSVRFFAPFEIDLNIRAVTGKKDSKVQVTTIDVLCWTIHETWNDIQRRAPFWAHQGMSHRSRHDAWKRFRSGDIGSNELTDTWLEKERKSLADLYAPDETNHATSIELKLDDDIGQRCKTLGVLSHRGVQLGEEQEREVNRERERERDVELPPEAEPAEHSLHPDVIHFVKTGEISRLHRRNAFQPVWKTLGESSAANRDAAIQSPLVLATKDFGKTIKPESTRGTMDQYLRPVQWVLSRKTDREQVLVLLSPFEASRLMPDIVASKHVHLHLYAPRTSKRMTTSDDLKFYTIPPLPSDWTPPWPLIDQLNLFSGQLYLRDFESYHRMRRLLDIPKKNTLKDAGSVTAGRKWLRKFARSKEENDVASAPLLSSVTALLGIRNRGRPFAHTHMGKMLQGQPLKEDFMVRMSDSPTGDPSSFGGRMPRVIPSPGTLEPSSVNAEDGVQGTSAVLPVSHSYPSSLYLSCLVVCSAAFLFAPASPPMPFIVFAF